MKQVYAGMAFLAATHACFAQARLGPPIETAPPPVVQASLGASFGSTMSPVESLVAPQASTGPKWWVEADYLLWWIRRGPLPTPLVTSGDPKDALPGALGQPGTRALFGGSGLDYGTFSGGRFNLGSWLDCDQTIGLEGGGFLFEQRVIHFAVASDNAGNPPIYLPVVNQNPSSPNFGRQSSFTIADPIFPGTGPTSGNVAVGSATRLWGAELNGLVNLARTSSWSLDGIVGFRYLDLQENLRMSGSANDQFDDLQQTFIDSFQTRDQFYGGQLGARFGFRSDRIALDVTGKVAFGSTHQVVDIQGSSFYAGTGFALPPGVFPGGVYTQPSNIGRTTANHFAVTPQFGLKLGLILAPRLTANVGYDLLYWSSVVRPGSQIDHNLNPTQFPGAGFNGALLPAPQFNRTDFLAQGISFGLAFKY
jgi:Putative beta barrel porin-7 (BBP7)